MRTTSFKIFLLSSSVPLLSIHFHTLRSPSHMTSKQVPRSFIGHFNIQKLSKKSSISDLASNPQYKCGHNSKGNKSSCINKCSFLAVISPISHNAALLFSCFTVYCNKSKVHSHLKDENNQKKSIFIYRKFHVPENCWH